MGYLLPSVMFMKLAWEFHFPNNIGMSQIICICMLLMTTFLSVQLPSYNLLCALLLSFPTLTTIVILTQVLFTYFYHKVRVLYNKENMK